MISEKKCIKNSKIGIKLKRWEGRNGDKEKERKKERERERERERDNGGERKKEWNRDEGGRGWKRNETEKENRTKKPQNKLSSQASFEIKI